jgi:hypothetical protein
VCFPPCRRGTGSNPDTGNEEIKKWGIKKIRKSERSNLVRPCGFEGRLVFVERALDRLQSIADGIHPTRERMWESAEGENLADEDGGLSMFDEERNVEFLSYDGYEVQHDRDVLIFRFSFCDAVRMAPELKIDLSRYRQLVVDLASPTTTDDANRQKVPFFHLS